MARTRLQYLLPDGRFRMGSGSIETRWANFLINHRDSEAHALAESPVGVEDGRERFRSWEEFLESEPPLYPATVRRQVVVCEQSAIFPVSMEMAVDPEDRQMQFKDAFEVGVQAATTAAINGASRDELIGLASMLSMAVFLVAALVVVGIALNSGMGQELINNLPGG